MFTNQFINFPAILAQVPEAAALIKGSSKYPKIEGIVAFYQTQFGLLISSELTGLPVPADKCENSFFGYHIHIGESCTGNDTDPFANALTHYNPINCPHPAHAGDLPPLFGNKGYAFSVLLTDRFSLEDIMGKTIIVHSAPDDFSTQPAGNSGEKIACGKIGIISHREFPF